MHDDLEFSYALSAGLDGSARERRLENQNGTRPARLVFEKPPRCPTADLFVSGPEHDDVRRPRAQFAKRAHGQHRYGDPAFHVEDSRTIQPAVAFVERHAVDRASGPHRIEVPKKKNRLSLIGARAAGAGVPFRAHMIARCRLPQARDICANFDQSSRELGAASIDSVFVVARRFKAHKGFENVPHPGGLRLAELEQVVDTVAHRFQSICAFDTFLWLNKDMVGRTFSRALFGAVALATSAIAVAQSPAPFPRPGQQPSRPPTQSPQPPPASAPAPATAAPADKDDPGDLGVPLYPGSQFITSYDAGRGQRYYLYGAESDFTLIVGWYKTALTQKGELVFEEPPVHMFEIGRYKEETMAFMPSVTVKDYTWAGSAGYINPKRGASPARFKTIIQIVPNPPGTPK